MALRGASGWPDGQMGRRPLSGGRQQGNARRGHLSEARCGQGAGRTRRPRRAARGQLASLGRGGCQGGERVARAVWGLAFPGGIGEAPGSRSLLAAQQPHVHCVCVGSGPRAGAVRGGQAGEQQGAVAPQVGGRAGGANRIG